MNSVGGGLGIRFIEEPLSASSQTPKKRSVLIAVRCDLTHSAAGVALPKSEQVGAAVIYRSSDSGATFAAHGSLSDWTSETDLIFPISIQSAGEGSKRVVLAVSRYQTRHFVASTHKQSPPQLDFQGYYLTYYCCFVF